MWDKWKLFVLKSGTTSLSKAAHSRTCRFNSISLFKLQWFWLLYQLPCCLLLCVLCRHGLVRFDTWMDLHKTNKGRLGRFSNLFGTYQNKVNHVDKKKSSLPKVMIDRTSIKENSPVGHFIGGHKVPNWVYLHLGPTYKLSIVRLHQRAIPNQARFRGPWRSGFCCGLILIAKARITKEPWPRINIYAGIWIIRRRACPSILRDCS